MAKFNLRDRVRLIGQDEIRTIEEIREDPAGETTYWIQLGRKKTKWGRSSVG